MNPIEVRHASAWQQAMLAAGPSLVHHHVRLTRRSGLILDLLDNAIIAAVPAMVNGGLTPCGEVAALQAPHMVDDANEVICNLAISLCSAG